MRDSRLLSLQSPLYEDASKVPDKKTILPQEVVADQTQIPIVKPIKIQCDPCVQEFEKDDSKKVKELEERIEQLEKKIRHHEQHSDSVPSDSTFPNVQETRKDDAKADDWMSQRFSSLESEVHSMKVYLEETGNISGYLQEMKIKQDKYDAYVDEFRNRMKCLEETVKDQPSNTKEKFLDLSERLQLLEETKGTSKTVESEMEGFSQRLQSLEQSVKSQEEDKPLGHHTGHITLKVSTSSASDKGQVSQKAWVIPQILYDDYRFEHILPFFLDLVKANYEAKHSVLITDEDNVLLPVVASSRVGSDVSAAVNKAALKKSVRPLFIVFHSLAPHNSKISIPTKRRLTDKSLTANIIDMIDTVYWNGKMYECDANKKAVNDIKQYL